MISRLVSLHLAALACLTLSTVFSSVGTCFFVFGARDKQSVEGSDGVLYKPKRIDTPVGTVHVQVPKTAGHDGEPFYPQSLERGRRSVRAVMLAVAEMYIKGVSTREVEAVMREFGIESLSSSQVSRATKMLDEELQAWRDRPLGEIKYLILDARYEKMRHGGIVRDVAVLSAIGIGPGETSCEFRRDYPSC